MKHKHLIKFPLATEEATKKRESSHKKSQWSHTELAGYCTCTFKHASKKLQSVSYCLHGTQDKQNECLPEYTS